MSPTHSHGPVVIKQFSQVVSVCLSISTFQNFAKLNNFQVRIVIATGGTVGWPSGSIMALIISCTN